MVSSKGGVRYEHALANAVYRRTGHRLPPQRDGYSGNGGVPSADILIEDGSMVHAFEVKKTSRDRQTFTYHPTDEEPGDIDELLTFAQQYQRPVCGYLGVSFPKRQLVLVPLWGGATPLEDAVAASPVQAKVTRADNISVPKPPTETQATSEESGWPNASDGDDVGYLLDVIGYEGPRRPAD